MIEILKLFILPPGLNIGLVLLGLFLWWHKHKKISLTLIVFAAVTLYLFCTPLVADKVITPLIKCYPALNLDHLPNNSKRTAIVVLSSGRTYAPEYTGMTVSPMSLVRIRYAARLARNTKLPILVSGGAFFKGREAEAILMQYTFEKDFLIPVRWVELRSNTTYENAKYCAEILANQGIKKIYLVTNAAHMKRAVYAFKLFGLNVIPAPTGYMPVEEGKNIHLFLPNVVALEISKRALYEYLGYFWYRLRYNHTA